MANHNPAGFPVQVGINNVGSYQVSGRPWATGSVEANTAIEVSFPYVTRWFQIINKAGSPLKVAFSHEGLDVAGTGSEAFNFTVDASGSNGYGKSERFEMKVSSIWCLRSGATHGRNPFDVVAGLTSIDARRTDKNFTGSYTGV